MYKELNTRLLREKSLRKLEDGYDLTIVYWFNLLIFSYKFLLF